MEETINIKEFFLIIKKRILVLLLSTAIGMVLSGLLSYYLIKPTYEAKSTLIVNTNNSDANQNITGDQISVTQKLAITYGEIIKSRTVLNPVISNLSLNMSYEELIKSVKVSPVDETQIIVVSVQSQIPEMAAKIVNEIPKVLKEEVVRITKSNTIEIIDKAIVPVKPIKPNNPVNIFIGTFLGIMAGISIIFMIEYYDNKIKSPQDIERYLGISVIGVIPKDEVKK